MKKEELQYILDNVDTLYGFVLTGSENIRQEHLLGGEKMNMVMAHTLTAIADSPGIRVSDVARMWDHTRGAASRNVDRLRRLGLITKEKSACNKKEVHLYPTDKGRQLAREHRRQDRESIEAAVTRLLEKHDFARIKTTLRVLDTLKKIWEEEQ